MRPSSTSRTASQFSGSYAAGAARITVASPDRAEAIAFGFTAQMYAAAAPPIAALAAAQSLGFMLERHASLAAKRNASSGVKRSTPEVGSSGRRKTRGTLVIARNASAPSAAAIAAAARSALTL